MLQTMPPVCIAEEPRLGLLERIKGRDELSGFEDGEEVVPDVEEAEFDGGRRRLRLLCVDESHWERNHAAYVVVLFAAVGASSGSPPLLCLFFFYALLGIRDREGSTEGAIGVGDTRSIGGSTVRR